MMSFVANMQHMCYHYSMEEVTIDWIKKRLQQKQMSQTDLAEKLDLHRAAISRLLKGEKKLDRVTQIAIYHILRENN